MKKTTTILLALLCVVFGFSAASAATIDLFEWALNKDGTVYDSTPATFNGLNSVTVNVSGAGSHYVGFFFDDEIDQTLNTFFNEYGLTMGTPSTGQSWEIDEPGFVSGDIYTNFTNGALDNSNAVPSSTTDDVSMAMGWNFDLLANQIASLTFNVSETAPTSGFYLTQYDPDSGASIFFSSALDIRTQGIPEPGTLMLLGTGLVGLLGWGRKKAIF